MSHLGATPRVLIVDDEPAVRYVVRMALERVGYQVDEVDSHEAVRKALAHRNYDAMVLDVGLGDDSGLEVLSEIRANSDLPVLLLTAFGSEPERVRGLELGADDYVVKPFSPRELAARVQAVLHRPAVKARNPLREFDGLTINVASHEVTLHGKPVQLTAKEFDLLCFLAHSPHQVFTKAQLLHHVWDSSPGWQTEATVSEHVHRLRGKIEADSSKPVRIVTVRGSGYRFDGEPS